MRASPLKEMKKWGHSSFPCNKGMRLEARRRDAGAFSAPTIRCGRSPASPYAAGAACAGTVDRSSPEVKVAVHGPALRPPGCLAPTHRILDAENAPRPATAHCRAEFLCYKEMRNVPI